MTGFTELLLDWLPTMIKAYAIDLVVFATEQSWILHGFRRKLYVQLQKAMKICESQNVATKRMSNRAITGVLRHYKAAGGTDFATRAFAMLMLAEGRSVDESVDIARLMQSHVKEIAVKFCVGATA
jgi:hypothetical protein